MNIKQTALAILKQQEKVKQEELNQFLNTVFHPSISELENQIQDWFKLNINPIVDKIELNSTEIVVMPPECKGRYNKGVNVYLRATWVGDKQIPSYCEINWYGSNASKTKTFDLDYLSILGDIAKNLETIEKQYIDVWYPKYLILEKERYPYFKELEGLKISIDALMSEIAKEAKDEYKQVGFELQLKSTKFCEGDWDPKGRQTYYKLVDKSGTLKLSTGRGKYQYVYVNWFKIKEFTKNGKVKLDFKNDINSAVREVEVTKLKFEEFINSVYTWNTKRADDETKKQIERFEKYKS
jgi:hypothetical protein